MVTRREVLVGSSLISLYVAGCSDGEDGGSETRPSSRIPDPVGHLTWRWGADPFALGAYSFLPPGAAPADRSTLGAPVGRLHFAGEATSVESPATAHGAYLSGQRAAGEVKGAANGGTVVVVGAGMAGLSAARTLADSGFTVVVVEGRHRYGGRVYTSTQLDDVPLDLGASWLHSASTNPLTGLTENFAIETMATDFDNVAVYGPSGEPVPEDEIDRMFRTATAAFAGAQEAGEAADEDRPLGPALDSAAGVEEMSDEERQSYEFALDSVITLDFAADPDQLSLWEWDEGTDDGEGDLLFPGGIGQIGDRLAVGLDIRLNHLVDRIDHGGESVSVSTSGGAIEGDFAIVTLPLSILQQERVGFDPVLPAEKRDAIGLLGMGLLQKLYLGFDSVFWDAGADGIAYVSPDGGAWSFFLNMHKSTGEPILAGFNGGSAAWAMEDRSDEEMVASAMQVLRTIYG